MAVKLYREYKIKFYLNMRHYIIINGTKGETHPHTWEFAINIRFGRSSSVEFNTFEKGIANYLSINSTGGVLTTLEASETPTRSYIVNLSEKEETQKLSKEADEKMLSDVMDAVLDEIIE